MFDLTGNVAAVTGSARGIGKAIALAMARAGASVVVSDIVEEAAQSTVAEALAAGAPGALYVKADVAKSAEAARLIDEAVAAFGRLDCLVNNAGITRDGLLIRMKDEDWQAVLAVNLGGAMYCSRAAAKPMMKQRSGSIINIASVVGVMGQAGQANYAASKAGVIGLTKSIAKEFASRGIRANAVAPGYIATDMTKVLTDEQKAAFLDRIPLGRPGEPNDVANACLFLASPLSSYVTGQVLLVDGGLLM